MRTFGYTVARTFREIVDAQRVRWRVYGEEERLLPPSACREGREIDVHDQDPDTVHILAYVRGEPVGTVRLLPARPMHRRARGGFGLDLESKFHLGGLSAPGLVLAEVTRYCVLRRYRCTGVTRALYAGLQVESRRRGITHWLAAANMETDCAEDAALAYRLVCARQLVDERFRAEPRAGLPAQTLRRQSCYSEAERRSGREGALDHLALPRTLALFATRMGGRYIGPPVYDPYFNVFALPLVAPLALPASPASQSLLRGSAGLRTTGALAGGG